MKIVAIRGRNIASLAGAFEVRLDVDPLRRVGLFAITGPTGAGKSTLLDCVCLALFDKVPRLRLASSRSKVRGLGVDGEEHAATDPRGLLRRGAGSGYAEVEFVDTSGARWRARWSVRRARNKADGKLQTSDVALYDADDNVVAKGRKNDVLAAIESRLGLGFEQFRRAALLAQGEFAAFLHADPTERATVLERVTGTELYAQISAAVYERWRTEREALTELDVRLQEVGVLPAEERTDTERQRDAVRQQRIKLERGKAEADNAITWHREADEHRAGVSQAEALAEAARTAYEAGAAEREELAALDTVAPLRAELQAVDGARQRRSDALRDVRTAETAELQARERESQARQRESQARLGVERAQHRSDEIQPMLEQARALDIEIAEAARAASDRGTEAEAAARAAGEAKVRADESRARVTALQAKSAEAEAWLHARMPIRTLVERWADLDQGLARLATSRGALHEHRQALGELRPRLADARREVTDQAEQHLQAEVVARSATVALDSARAAVPDGARAAVAERRGTVEAHRRTLAEARRVADLVALRRGEHQRGATRVAEATVSAEAARTAAAEHERHAATTAIRLEEARRALERLQATRSLEGHRSRLEDGTACPLCGSLEHPWAVDGAPEAAMLQEQERRVHDLDAELQRARQAQARASADERAAVALSASAQHEADAAQREVEEHLRVWSALVAAHPDLPADPASDALTTLEQSLRDALEALDADEAALASAEALLRTRQAEHEAARAHLDQQTLQLTSQKDLVQRHTAEETHLVQLEQAEAARVLEREADLEPALAAVVPWPPDDIAATRAEVGGLIDKARVRVQTLTLATTELGTLRAQVAEAEAVLTTNRVEAQRRKAAHTTAQDRLGELQSTRRGLLDGRPTVEVSHELSRQLREATEALSAAFEARSEAVARAAGAQARLEQARGELAEAVTAVVATEQILDAALAPLDLDEAQLRSRLSRSPEALRALRAHQDALRAALERSRTLVEERRQKSEKHHAVPQPPPPRELVEATLGSIEAGMRQAQQEQARLDARIQADDTARTRATELADERARQEATLATWRTLRDLIGSQDGRTFKRFAQSLTLDSLLAHANRHLNDLAPRFRLVRVPGSELDLQVIDRTMGDEVRAVHTLSGGETFLASLALALGLASLSAADTPVESLFIDEGFGTLDRETLDTALAALDALQASGRQVGIISHVAGLAERIGVQVQVQPQGAGRSRVVVSAS